MTPTKKRVITGVGSVAGFASSIGAAAHVGQYAALGFLDTKLSQVVRVGKEFVPDGVHALLGTLNRVAYTVYSHPFVTLAVVMSCAVLAWYSRRQPRMMPAVFVASFVVVVLFTLPAFTLFDLLHDPPDPTRVPATRFSRMFLLPVVEGLRFSRVPPVGNSAYWDPTIVRSSLSNRYVIIVAATIYLFVLKLIAVTDDKRVRRAATALAIAAALGTSYYWGAIEEETTYNRTVALKGHASHDEHAAFVIATVGHTCSVYSFEYGNEQIEDQFTDTDPERKDDILLTRLLRP